MFRLDTRKRATLNTALRLAFVALATCLIIAGCAGTTAQQRQLIDPAYEFGPQQGYGDADCQAATPPPPPEPYAPSGCVTRFIVRPGSIDVDLKTFYLPSVGWVDALACQSSTRCSAVEHAKRTSPPGGGIADPVAFSATLTLNDANLATGIVRICGTAYVFVPGMNLKSYPLTCINLAGFLQPAAGAFDAVSTRDGIVLQGWALDLLTDGPGTVSFHNGSQPGSPTVAATADKPDSRSKGPWPGFSDRHGFRAVLPYAAEAGPRNLCVRLPATPAIGERTVACFLREERPASFGPDAPVTQGDPITISLHSIGAGTTVRVNLQSDGGYFIMPWTHPAIWQSTADNRGAAGLTIDSTFLPPADYTIAFNCVPDCPYGNLSATDLVGGPALTGAIGLGSHFTVTSASVSTLTVTSTSPDTVRVAGTGFPPNKRVRLVALPNVRVFDGPPTEAAAVEYPVVDPQGKFSVDLQVGGFPLANNHTQIVAFLDDGRPAATTFYSG
jgi:hypothetical protein